MNHRKIFKELNTQVNQNNQFKSILTFNNNIRVIRIYHKTLNYYYCLEFGINHQNMLTLNEEVHKLNNKNTYVTKTHQNLVIGEPNYQILINTINLYTNYGKAYDENNPNMDVLLNTKYMKTKSASFFV